MPSSDANERLAAIGKKIYDEHTEMVELMYKHCCDRGGANALRGLLHTRPDLVRYRLRGGTDTPLTAVAKNLPTYRAIGIFNLLISTGVDLSNQVDNEGRHAYELLLWFAENKGHLSADEKDHVSASDWRAIADMSLSTWGEDMQHRLSEVQKKALARAEAAADRAQKRRDARDQRDAEADADEAKQVASLHIEVERALGSKRPGAACDALLAASTNFSDENFLNMPARTMSMLLDCGDQSVRVEAMSKVDVFDFSLPLPDGHNVASKSVMAVCKELPECTNDEERDAKMEYFYSCLDSLRHNHPRIMKGVLRLVFVGWLNEDLDISSDMLRSLAKKFMERDAAICSAKMADLLSTTEETPLDVDKAKVAEFMECAVLHPNIFGSTELEQFLCREWCALRVTKQDEGIAFKLILLFGAVLTEDRAYARELMGTYVQTYLGDSEDVFGHDDSNVVSRLAQINDPELLVAAVGQELRPRGDKRVLWKLAEAASRGVPCAEMAMLQVMEISPEACSLRNHDGSLCIEPLNLSVATPKRTRKDGEAISECTEDGDARYQYAWVHSGCPGLVAKLAQKLAIPAMSEVAQKKLPRNEWTGYWVNLAGRLTEMAVFNDFLYVAVDTQWLPTTGEGGQFCPAGGMVHTRVAQFCRILVDGCWDVVASLDPRQLGHFVRETLPLFLATPANGEPVFVTMLRKLVTVANHGRRCAFFGFKALMKHAGPHARREVVAAKLDELIVGVLDEELALPFLRTLYKAYDSDQINEAAAPRFSQDEEQREYNIRSFCKSQGAGEGVFGVLDEVFGPPEAPEAPEASESSEPPNKKRRV